MSSSICPAADTPSTVSVVIPARDAARYIDECLASVAAQQGPFSLQVIVVDDGSRDDTAARAAAHPGVQVLATAGRGPAAARNAGLAAAHGEFVAFLDADDAWPAGKLARQLAVLQRVPEAAFVFGDCRQFDATGPRPGTEFEAGALGRRAWGPGPLLPDAYERLLSAGFVTTGSVVARRQALADAGGFRESLLLVEDLDLWLRLARRAAVAWVAEVCLLRRLHEHNASRDRLAMATAYVAVLQAQDRAGRPGALLARLVARECAHIARMHAARSQSQAAWHWARRAWAAHRSPGSLAAVLRAGTACLMQAVRRRAQRS